MVSAHNTAARLFVLKQAATAAGALLCKPEALQIICACPEYTQLHVGILLLSLRLTWQDPSQSLMSQE
jgi:hypothetical protein